MSSSPNKVRTFGAIILLATTCIISASAQTQPAVATSNVAPDPIRESRATTVETKPIAPTGHTGLAAASGETSKVNPPAAVSDPTTTDAETTVAAGEAEAIARTATASRQPVSTDKWEFQFSPYFWLASLHGTAGIGNRTTQLDESFSDIFHSLDFALMGVFEARKGKLVVLTDLEYVAVSDDKATPGPLFSDVNAKFKTFIFDPEVGYRVFENPAKGQFVDVLGGIRVWHVSTELNFGAGILPATQVEGSRNWVDAIVGLRGKMALSPKLFVTGKFDLGGGGSKFTWQLFGGGGYNVNQRVALIFGYRVLDVNYDKNNFLYDMNQRGPIMGLGFKF